VDKAMQFFEKIRLESQKNENADAILIAEQIFSEFAFTHRKAKTFIRIFKLHGK